MIPLCTTNFVINLYHSLNAESLFLCSLYYVAELSHMIMDKTTGLFLQRTFWLVTVGKCVTYNINNVFVLPKCAGIKVSQHAQLQVPVNVAAKWSWAIIHFIIYTYAVPTVTWQNFLCKKGLSIFSKWHKSQPTSSPPQTGWPLERCAILRVKVQSDWTLHKVKENLCLHNRRARKMTIIQSVHANMVLRKGLISLNKGEHLWGCTMGTQHLYVPIILWTKVTIIFKGFFQEYRNSLLFILNI